MLAPVPGAPARRATLAWLAAPLLATAVALAPALANGFAMDDRLVARGVDDSGQPLPRIFELQPLGVYFSTPYWADTRPNDTLYRPLVTLSFALRHRFFGDAPLPEHAANLLLHLVATALVFALARRLALSAPAASGAAALFGLHAIHSEVVATVVGRAELLAFVGGAAAALALLAAEARKGAAPGLRSLAAFAFLAALLAKENAVGWLVAIPALLLAARAPAPPGDRRALAALAARTAAVLLPSLALFLALRARMLAGLDGPPDPVLFLVNPIAQAPLATRLATATIVLAWGMLLALAPFRLAADYGAHVFPLAGSFAHPLALAAAALVTSVAVGGWLARRRAPLLAAATATFFGFALVTANLLIPIGTIFGERLYYAPSLAVALAAGWVLERCRAPGPRAAAALALGLWLGASTVVLVARHGVWRDDETLFLAEAEHQPRSVRMQLNAANVLSARGERSSAFARLERAVELEPGLAIAWNNLAALHLDAGDLDAAEAAARRGLAAAHRAPDDEYRLRANLGLIAAARGEDARAAEELVQALALEPAFVRAWQELSALAGASRVPAGALARAAAEVGRERPGTPWADLYRGLAALAEGRLPAADEDLARALAGLPRHGAAASAWATGALGRAEALLGRGRHADARALLADLTRDPFTPAPERAIAAAALAAPPAGLR